MRTVVTGAAGFIGSTLSRELLRQGHSVRGIDAFTSYYDERLKRRNVEELKACSGFELLELDLAHDPLVPVLAEADVVFHLAGQPGVRGSWAHGFLPYLTLNVHATQRVLEAAKQVGTARVVYASSSSIYGNAARYPCREGDVPAPHSPYGVTKLAGEHLNRLYAANHGVPTVSLRYFTVFGPRQRPEMAMARLIETALTGRPFPLFAAPGTLRDFTFVDDVVQATILAGTIPHVPPGTILNIAGGAPATMAEVVDIVGELLGAPVALDVQPACAGDVLRTGGDSTAARDLLGWRPRTSLHDGLAQQVQWGIGQELAHIPAQVRHSVVDLTDAALAPAREWQTTA